MVRRTRAEGTPGEGLHPHSAPRGLLQGVILMALAITLFGVTVQGNIFLVFGLLLLGVFSFVGLGIVLTSITSDQQTAAMLMTTDPSITDTLMFPWGESYASDGQKWYRWFPNVPKVNRGNDEPTDYQNPPPEHLSRVSESR